MLKLDIHKRGTGGGDSDSDKSELVEVSKGRESPGVMRVQSGNGEVTELLEENAECYPNQSFSLLESTAGMNKWFGRTAAIEDLVGSSASISTSAEI